MEEWINLADWSDAGDLDDAPIDFGAWPDDAIREEVEKLARRTGDSARYLLCENVPLESLTADSALCSALGKGAVFRFVLCRNDCVALLCGLRTAYGEFTGTHPLLAEKGAPVLQDGDAEHRQERLRQQLAASVEALRAREAPGAGEAGEARGDAVPWRFAQMIAGRQYWKQLTAKRLLTEGSYGCVSEYGASLGLIEVTGPFFLDGPGCGKWTTNISCPVPCLERLQASSAPLPQWEKLPFAARWEQIRKYGGGLAQIAQEMQHLMQMPFTEIFEPYLSMIPKKYVAGMRRDLQEVMEEYRQYAGYLPDTYLQAVREWVRVCRSRDIPEADWPEDLGEDGLWEYPDDIEVSALTLAWDLLLAFKLVYGKRSSQKDRSDKNKASAGSEQQQPSENGAPNAPARTEHRTPGPQERPAERLLLAQRLRMAGISAEACPSMPLAGVDLRRVFEAADALAGTGYYTWSLQRRSSAESAYAGLPEESTVKQLEALLGSTWAEYAWEFPALFGIKDPRSALGPPEITYDGMLANISDALHASVYGLFEVRGSGHSPYSLLYELMAAPLFSVAAAQEETGKQ